MPRNGSGIYGPPAGTAAVPNTTIESADYNSVVADLSQALTDSINVAGTAPFQGNQSMGDNKLVNLSAGSAAGDSVNLGQVQTGTVTHAATIGGTADAIALTFSPPFSAYVAKMRFRFTASLANTLAAPTINVDGLGLKTIKKLNGVALEPGDIAGPGHVCECVYDGTDVLLLNFAPMTTAEANVFTERQTFNRPIISPVSTLADAATIAWNMNANSVNVRIVLSASRALGAPTNLNTGQTGLFIIQQDATGGWSLTPNAIFKQSGGQTVFDLDKTANTKTLYRYEVIEDHTATRIILIKRLWSEGKTSFGFYKDYTINISITRVIRTLAHGLGRHPAFVNFYIENTSPELGFSVGERVSLPSPSNVDSGGGGNINGFNLSHDTTNCYVIIGDTIPVHQKAATIGNVFGIDLNKWDGILRVYE